MTFITTIKHVLTSSPIGLLVLLSSCRSGAPDQEAVRFEGLTVVAQQQRISERQWEDVAIHKLYEVPREPNVSLFMAGPIRIGSDGSLYYMDPGDMKVKHFDADGFFVGSYGGRGAGPGEIRNVFTDAALMGDSILYVTDQNSRTVSFFAVETDSFLYSLTGIEASRYRITSSGREYWHGSGGFGGILLFGTRKDSVTHRFGKLLQNPAGSSTMLVTGDITLYGERTIFVPLRWPFIMQYDSTGAVVYSRTTPDVGRVSPPSLERPTTRFGFGIGVRGRSVQGYSDVYGSKLVVYAFVGDSTKAFDIYDADTGDYQHSISVPWGRIHFGTYDPTRGRIWQVKDTSVVVYAVTQ